MGEAGVVEAEEVEERGVEVVDVDFVGHGVEAEFVATAEGEAGFDAAAGCPMRIMLIPPAAASAGRSTETLVAHPIEQQAYQPRPAPQAPSRKASAERLHAKLAFGTP